ncbi:MAG: hypothetical protein IIC13_14085 [SAR324 cluster bacterium]|nr:hypothetical protein [SAR324 cluster bacterium]
MEDEDGKIWGNPNRYLLFLYLGKVKCIYLGGKWERYIGWVKETSEPRAFKSPSCNRGKHAGDIISLPQNSGGQDDDEGDGRFHLAGAEIKARVISSDPAFSETRIRVTIPVVAE